MAKHPSLVQPSRLVDLMKYHFFLLLFRGMFVKFIQFMYILMEEFTNLGKYPKPIDPTLVKSVIAECDGYIVTSGVPSLQELWPGAQVEVSI